MSVMKTRLKWLSAYFLFASAIGFIRISSQGISYEWLTLSSLVGLTFTLVYLYCGLHFKTLFPKWKTALQTLVAFTILSNLIFIYFGADVDLSETDTLGKIYTILIFLIPAVLGSYIIYQIEILSKQLSQPQTNESNDSPTLVPIQPKEQSLLSNRYFLILTPIIVTIVSQAITAIAFYIPVSQATSEQILAYALYGAIIFACIYSLLIFYWLIKKQYLEMGYALIGLIGGITTFYIISVYAFNYLP